ncbi:MAG: hypothetical protein IKU29_06665 [Parabacteroides sp.]|nr:hypothetical protein [Parabacteroides sp.]
MREWPIVRFWYTQKQGKTIEEIIDQDIDWFEWALKEFQNVTPSQANHYHKVTGKKIPQKFIQDVEPYLWQKGDRDGLYMDLCRTQDLEGTLRKWRGEQLSLF